MKRMMAIEKSSSRGPLTNLTIRTSRILSHTLNTYSSSTIYRYGYVSTTRVEKPMYLRDLGRVVRGPGSCHAFGAIPHENIRLYIVPKTDKVDPDHQVRTVQLRGRVRLESVTSYPQLSPIDILQKPFLTTILNPRNYRNNDRYVHTDNDHGGTPHAKYW
jgi:hypothetical protein